MPHDSTSDKLHQIYSCPSLTVRAIALRPSNSHQADAVPNLPFRHQPVSLNAQSGPSNLSRGQLGQWLNNIVGAMFPEGAGSPPSRGAPDFIKYTRATEQYPLPLPVPDETETDLVYICQAPPIPGKFNNSKATELKVPIGRVRGHLVAGEAIEVEDQGVPGGLRVVRPEDVISGGSSGGVSRIYQIVHIGRTIDVRD